MNKISIAIVDDNHFLISAIEEKLSFFDDLRLVQSFNKGRDLLEFLIHSGRLDLVLMDIEMPEMNGIEVTRAVKQINPQIKVVMLTVFDNDEHIFNAIKAGADGYLLKEVEPQLLHDGILQTMNGGAAMTPSIAMRTLRLLRNPESFESLNENQEVKLTSREIDVLEQLSKGLSYTAIAENLFISPSTVRKHLENIYQKLQVHSKLEAVQLAKRRNLI